MVTSHVDKQENAVPAVTEGPVQPDRTSCRLCLDLADTKQVAIPYISRWFWKDRPLPVMMVSEGIAVVYEAGGAEYGPWGMKALKDIERQSK